MTMWSSTLPLVTCSDAVPVLPVSLPVTVCAPATEAVQVAPVQEPSGAIENVVAEVTSPRLLSYWSRPCAVYVCEPPALIVADAGDRVRAGDRRRTDIPRTRPVRPDRERRRRSHIAERIVRRVETLSRVALRTARGNRRGRGTDDDVVEHVAARDLQRRGTGLARVPARHCVRARHGSGARGSRAGAIRRDRERRGRGHVTEAVVVLVARIGRVRLRAAGRDRR